MTIEGFIWGAIFITFWVIVGVGVLRFLFSPRWSDSGNNARGILDERYARGDISKAEYTQKRADIEGRSSR
ncbi:MAG: SHOCT domain-containing protein [Sphaerobacteraceae bacterium]|nr:MAG: SHOCT domain-containing protein [Sphaerobacteraceae bacterium]